MALIALGDKITFVPNGFGERKEAFDNGVAIPQKLTGRVVWIHPKERFYLVEAEIHGGTIRETFYMGET